MYRSDRSQLTHPADPNDPLKFRKFGGGVLIAIRSDIEASVKRLSIRKGAEMLAVEIDMNGTKFIFCTVYRVGTLGDENHESIINSVKSFYQGRNHKKIFIVGDFNLSSVSWPLNDDIIIRHRLDRLFIDSFNELGLHQCINNPTHCKGKTLDLLLTNDASAVNNVHVHEQKIYASLTITQFPLMLKLTLKIKSFQNGKFITLKELIGIS